MMATNSEVPDDSRLLTHSPPPPYNTSTLASSADSAKGITSTPRLLPSLRVFLTLLFFNRQKRKVILSRIRDLVSTPDFIPSSIAPVIKTCIAQGALSPAEFSAFLQLPFVEGHSAMYWAILNHR
jgi:hypothetical protein